MRSYTQSQSLEITEIDEDYAEIIRQCAEVDQGVNNDSGSALTESGHKAIFAFFLYGNGFSRYNTGRVS